MFQGRGPIQVPFHWVVCPIGSPAGHGQFWSGQPCGCGRDGRSLLCPVVARITFGITSLWTSHESGEPLEGVLPGVHAWDCRIHGLLLEKAMPAVRHASFLSEVCSLFVAVRARGAAGDFGRTPHGRSLRRPRGQLVRAAPQCPGRALDPVRAIQWSATVPASAGAEAVACPGRHEGLDGTRGFVFSTRRLKRSFCPRCHVP
jgi:hypothetical protein